MSKPTALLRALGLGAGATVSLVVVSTMVLVVLYLVATWGFFVVNDDNCYLHGESRGGIELSRIEREVAPPAVHCIYKDGSVYSIQLLWDR